MFRPLRAVLACVAMATVMVTSAGVASATTAACTQAQANVVAAQKALSDAFMALGAATHPRDNAAILRAKQAVLDANVAYSNAVRQESAACAGQ
jgi:hypothetical protein